MLNVTTSVAKWGNAPAIRIPKSVMKEANLQEGDAVRFEVKEPGVIVVILSKAKPTLDELLGRITAKNRHSEIDWGRPAGKEVW